MPPSISRPDAPTVLTEELLAHLKPLVDDPGPAPGLDYLTDEEYRTSIQAALSDAPDQSAIWIFAYGSLIWKPGFRYTERHVGAVSGWHRSFCLRTTRWRGTPNRPGLIMALEPGGQCHGVAFKLAPDTLEDDLNTLWRRELGVKPVNHDVRWVRVRTDHGDVAALTFTANRSGQSYVGDISPETSRHLEAAGIHDAGLAHPGSLVAERIAAKHVRSA